MNNPEVKIPRAAFSKLLLNETRLAWRTPTGLGMGLGIPLLLLIVFGSIPVFRQPSSDLGGYSYFALSFPILLALTIMALSVQVLPQSMIIYRQTGILRRLSVTPVPPSWLLAAQIAINLSMAVAGAILLIAVGVAAFGLELPKGFLGFLLAYILTVTSIFAVGLCITALVKSPPVAQGIGSFLFIGLLFFGGIWLPRLLMPPVLIDISNWTPFGAAVVAIQNAMQGLFPSLQSILVLLIYTLVFGYLAVRYFKWE